MMIRVGYLLMAVLTAAPAVAATAETPVAPVPDPAEDRETAIISQRIGAKDYVIAAWVNGTEGTGTPQIRVASAEVSSSGFGAWTPTTLGGFWNGGSGDPSLAENVNNSGIAPKRVYLAGTSHRRSGDLIGENQITVWFSDNGGGTWGRLAALSHSLDGTRVAKEPSIAVSLEPQTRGQVYVAHLLSNGDPNQGRIVVYRSNDRGEFSSTPTAVLDDPAVPVGAPHSPVILVDPLNLGWVYVAWLNLQNDTVNVAFSSDSGNTFSVVRSASAGTLLKAGSDQIGNGQGALASATSTLAARFNCKSNTIGIAWHASEPGNSASADVKFISWDPVSQAFGARQTVTVDSDGSTEGSQWSPALDYDANGDYLVTYYDTRGAAQSATAFNYFVNAARLHAEGSRVLPPASDLRLTPQPSDLMLYGNRRAGDSQDVWNWFGEWYAGFIQISSGHGDAAVSRIIDAPPAAAER